MPELSDEEYHAGDYKAGGLYVGSHTLQDYGRDPLKLLIDRGRAIAAKESGEKQGPVPDALRVGAIAHRMVLEGVSDIGIVPNEFITASGMLSTSKASVAWQLEQDREFLTPAEAEMIGGMCQAINKNDEAQGRLENCQVEVASRMMVNGLPCQIKPDAYDQSNNVLIDFKTCRSIYDIFDKYRNQYIGQLAFYSMCLQAAGLQRPECYILACEKEAPYNNTLIHVTESALDSRWDRVAQTMDAFAESIDTGYFKPKWDQLTTMEAF